MEKTNKNKAIFLDRDGVINKEKEYLYKIEDFEFIDGVIESLQYFSKKNYLLFIITNQSGIGRNYYTKNDFQTLTTWMLNELNKYGIKISQVELCPHTPTDNCNCRKPLIGMINNILNNYSIDLENSWLIGDKNSDILCAKNANIKNTIQVKSGHKFDTSKANYVIDSLNLLDIKTIFHTL
jgi:D-glycero-D-manno-heptose 1,7-bisphosphate phosphatase